MHVPDLVTPAALTATATGFATCLALLSSLGAQNLLLIRHGMERHRTGLMVGIFLVFDVVLVVLGVVGVAGALAAAPLLREVLTAVGADRPRTSSVPAGAEEDTGVDPGGRVRRPGGWVVAGAATAVTRLNPQVLLETMFVLGTAGSSHGASGQWWFAAGSVLASTVWFCGIGYAARSLSGLLDRPTT